MGVRLGVVAAAATGLLLTGCTPGERACTLIGSVSGVSVTVPAGYAGGNQLRVEIDPAGIR